MIAHDQRLHHEWLGHKLYEVAKPEGTRAIGAVLYLVGQMFETETDITRRQLLGYVERGYKWGMIEGGV